MVVLPAHDELGRRQEREAVRGGSALARLRGDESPALQQALPPRRGCSCPPSDDTCATRVRDAARAVYAAHLNYALSADEKVRAVCACVSVAFYLC